MRASSWLRARRSPCRPTALSTGWLTFGEGPARALPVREPEPLRPLWLALRSVPVEREPLRHSLAGVGVVADAHERAHERAEVAHAAGRHAASCRCDVMVVDMALRHTPVGAQGQDRYVLVGFQPDGE